MKNRKDYDDYINTIMKFSRNDHAITVLKMLKRLDDINITDKGGQTALMHASTFSRSQATIQILLDNNANINIKDKLGQTALICASQSKNAEVVKLLLDHGAEINITDNKGMTPLMHASTFYTFAPNDILHYQVTVQTLLDYRAEINITDNNGMTALMHASSNGLTLTVQMLLDHGAEINIKDKKGKTALMHAYSHDRKDIVKILLDNTTKINMKIIFLTIKHGEVSFLWNKLVAEPLKKYLSSSVDQNKDVGFNVIYTSSDKVASSALDKSLDHASTTRVTPQRIASLFKKTDMNP